MFTTLKVYDILGREIATLVNEYQLPGKYSVRFNVETLDGASLPSGVYFYQLKYGSLIQTCKMILLK
ncbi:MAG: T9SS type A sorting domain-containing protein [Bacteroidota bacterium]